MSGQPCMIHPWLLNPIVGLMLVFLGIIAGFSYGMIFQRLLDLHVHRLFARWRKP